MSGSLDDVKCASLPAEALRGLAGLRTRPGLRTLEQAGRVWVWWSAGDGEVLSRVLPLPGVELYAHRDGAWFRHGHRLPSSEVPSEDGARALLSVLTPAPCAPQEASLAPERVRLSVVRDGGFRPATALLCELTDLAHWAETATSRQLDVLEGTRIGGRVLLRGERLPTIAGADRLWGHDVLVPLGFSPDPDLPESILAQALALEPGEVALLTSEGVERVPGGAFGPVSRAAVRLATHERD